MTQVLLGKEVPNLKITLGNDDDSDAEDFEEGEISDPECEIPISKDEEIQLKHVKVTREFLDPLKGHKVYENKGGAFVTGLDLSSESLLKKLEGRATRFGLEKNVENKITQEEIDALYKSMGIDLELLKNSPSKVKNFRLDAIHMRGVDDMNTNQIFMYFNDYGPSSVEWINDSSCNVVWLDETSTARALLGMSRALVRQKIADVAEDSQASKDSGSPDKETSSIIKSAEGEDVILLSDDSTDDDETEDSIRKILNESKSCISMDVDPLPEENSSDKKLNVEDPLAVGVPIPPGLWRVGLPHPKAKALLLRFATKDDKKLPGAEKRSQYYQKYGNPNYGGLKGLISTSRKRKIQATRTRQVVEKLTDEPKQFNMLIKAGIDSDDEPTSAVANQKQNRTKVRMRMYADDEEEKQEKQKFSKRFKGDDSFSKQLSVHDRLGKKFTTTKLRRPSIVEDSSGEDSELQITREIKVPSRYNVWTTLAKSMAEEDAEMSRFEQPKSKTKDLRNTDSRTRDSRNTNVRTKDLRDSLSSSNFRVSVRRKEPRHSKPSTDLRSRIKRIRDDDLVSKHRSPLLLPDRRSSESD